MLNAKGTYPVATAHSDPNALVLKVKSRNQSLSYFVNISIKTTICLLLAFLTVEHFFPNIIINIFGFISLSIFIYFTTIGKNDYFGFIFLIFILAHFNYGSNQGGVVNYVALFVIVAAIITKNIKIKRDLPLLATVGILLTFNFAGYFFNPTASFTEVAKGATAFVAYILVFVFCSSLRFRLNNTGSFLVVLLFISLYSMFIAMNYKWNIYVIDNPIPFLTPNPERFGSLTGTNMTGNSELYGEECLMLLAFCMPILLSIKHVKFTINTNWLIITLVLLTSVVGLFLSRSRSVFILLVIFILLLPFLLKMVGLNIGFTLRKIIIPIFLLISIVYVLWDVLSMDYSLGRLVEIDTSHLTGEGIISGEQINRGPIFKVGYDRLRNESWFIGFGWLTMDYNLENSLGRFREYWNDLHSLYLTLPLYFGWIGTVAFLSIILITLKRLLSVIGLNKSSPGGWSLVALCFLLSIILFVLNEFKIGIIREPNYFMTIWIWLGLANALYRTSKRIE